MTAGGATAATTGSDGTATAGGTTASASGLAADGIAIGLRLQPGGAGASAHAIGDTFWSSTIASLGQTASGSILAATLVVGVNQNGNCIVSVPKSSSSSYSNVSFSVDPNVDTLLTMLDALSAKVVLEVQPGKASLSDLATVVLTAYGSHASVAGFGVDVQYKGTTSYSASAKMSNSEATALVASIHAINPGLMLYAKATKATNLPDSTTADVVFVNDASGFGDQQSMISAQSDWASYFSPASVQFDIGNTKDASWWCSADIATTTTALLGAALKAGSNVTGLYWQADGIVQVYPEVTCTSPITAPAATTTTTAGATTAAGTSNGTSSATAGGTSATGSTSAGGGSATTATTGNTTGTTAGNTTTTTAGNTTTTTAGNTTATTAGNTTATTVGNTTATTAGNTTAGSTTAETTGSTSSGTTSNTTGSTTATGGSGTATTSAGTATGNAGS